MADHHHAPDTDPAIDGADHHLPSLASTLTTFAVLVGLTVVALAVGFSTNFGSLKVLASLVVAGVQASVLSLYFMELKQADNLTWLVAGAAVFWMILLFLFTLTDYLTRHMAAY